MDWNNKKAAEGAAAGAAVGSFIPGVGTAVGGLAGGVIGGTGLGPKLDPTNAGKSPYFQTGTYTRGQNFQGKGIGPYDPSGGGKGLKGLESTLGIQSFDPNEYKGVNLAALRSQVADSTRRASASVADDANSRGFIDSGTAAALGQEATLKGDQTLALGTAQITNDATGMQLAENARRTGAALGIADKNLDTSKFNAEYDMNAYKLNEDLRRYDNEAEYGRKLDSFNLNEMSPWQARQQRKASVMDAGASIAGAGAGAAGMAIGMI